VFFIGLSGYSGEVTDHQVTVFNSKSGAGITFICEVMPVNYAVTGQFRSSKYTGCRDSLTKLIEK